MKAIVVTGFGAEPKLADLPTPAPGPGQLLVRLRAAGLNPFDWKVADGALKGAVVHAFPLVMGADGAGVVERVGPGVTRFQPGDTIAEQVRSLHPEGARRPGPDHHPRRRHRRPGEPLGARRHSHQHQLRRRSMPWPSVRSAAPTSATAPPRPTWKPSPLSPPPARSASP
ncbi:alcohol dehydrogenase catalytic domain-containing protein [Nonomuraea sp. NPDC049400]|uniref:alcohol dehydrogenase catalytic domain-containing protein n=1 Tax=Nonomuraea sp. NPDC049400 TaxID=3364352 RepID=UPI0037B8940A